MAGPELLHRPHRDWSKLIVRAGRPAPPTPAKTSERDRLSTNQTTRLLLAALCTTSSTRSPLALSGHENSHLYSICDAELSQPKKRKDRPDVTTTVLKASWNSLVRGTTRTISALAKAPLSTSCDPTAFAKAKRSIDRAVGKLESYTTFEYSLSEKQLGEIAELAVDIALTLESLPKAARTIARTAARLERLGGLYRKVANTGPFARYPVPMQHRVVRAVLRRAGINMQGVKVKIVRDAKAIGVPFLGYTHPHGRVIELYPEAFSSMENLVKTLGHEYTHVYQIRTFGKVTSSLDGGAFERASRAIEDTFWSYFLRNHTRGR